MSAANRNLSMSSKMLSPEKIAELEDSLQARFSKKHFLTPQLRSFASKYIEFLFRREVSLRAFVLRYAQPFLVKEKRTINWSLYLQGLELLCEKC